MVLIGFMTGLLLVVALPPVIRRFPPDRMPITSAAVNLGLFGAVTAGPLIGGAVAYGHAWRPFYGGLAGMGAAVFATALFTLPDQPPPDPELRSDFPAIALALAASVLPFLASAELIRHSFRSAWFIAPLAVGFACLVTMLLSEFHQQEPLAPVKPMWHTSHWWARWLQ